MAIIGGGTIFLLSLRLSGIEFSLEWKKIFELGQIIFFLQLWTLNMTQC